MPIYGLKKKPWIPVKKFTKFERLQYQMLLTRCLNNICASSVNDDYFKASIHNSERDDCIAYYDFSKSKLPMSVYQSKMEELITTMNSNLGVDKDYQIMKDLRKIGSAMVRKESEYKIDIMGNWTIGKIIVMQKNYEDADGLGSFPTTVKFKSIRTFKTVKNIY